MNDPTEGAPGDDVLRAAFALTSETATRRPDCPAEERVWEAAHGRLSPAETRTLADHAASCGACVEAWRLARVLAQPAPALGRIVSPRRPWATAWATAWARAAAAGLIVLAGAALWRAQMQQVEAPVMRQGEDQVLLSLLPENEALPRSRFLLKWSPAGEGAVYDLYVVTEDLTNIASTRGIRTHEFLVPESALVSLPAGSTVFWRISARLPDGRGLTSPSFPQRVQ